MHTDSGVERLEDRALLAGNVVASLNGPHLSVVGDSADNAVEISVENNRVQLRGLNDTTINGGTAVFVVAANTDTATGNMLIALGSGNDSAVFSRNVKLGGNISVVGGAGNDALSSTGATFQNNVAFHGNEGNDTFSLQDSTTQAALIIHGHAGDDLISLTDMTINGPVGIKTRDGEDAISFNNVSGTGAVGIKTGRGDDSVTIRNSTMGGTVSVWTRQDQDVVMMDTNTFNGQVSINLGRNNDAVDLRNINTFNQYFHVLGGDSKRGESGDVPNGDQINIPNTTVFNAGRRETRVEGTDVSTGARNRFDAATTGVIARATAADSAASALATTVSVTATSARSATSVGGAIITKDANVTISGTTLPGATVTVDSDNDGQFDDFTLTADANGAYSTPVVVTRKDLYTTDNTANDQLTGLQTIRVRSTLAGAGTSDASVVVDFVQNTVMRFTSNLGTFEVELFDTQAPGATGNFRTYTTSGRYTDSIIHRSVDNFVIQGGGFTIKDGLISSVPTNAAIPGEFNNARKNIKGTISMAHTGDPSSGTSQWFLNLRDNPDLDDSPTRRHTVFGRIVGNGQTVVDAIGALNQTDLNDEANSSALGEVPLLSTYSEFARTLTGTVSTTANSTTIVGTGTRFLTELKGSLTGLRSRIQINGQSFFVASIADDTHLTVTAAPTTASTDVVARTEFRDTDFVKFTSIAEILDTM